MDVHSDNERNALSLMQTVIMSFARGLTSSKPELLEHLCLLPVQTAQGLVEQFERLNTINASQRMACRSNLGCRANFDIGRDDKSFAQQKHVRSCTSVQVRRHCHRSAREVDERQGVCNRKARAQKAKIWRKRKVAQSR